MYNQLFIRLLNCSSSFDGRTRAPPCTGGGNPRASAPSPFPFSFFRRERFPFARDCPRIAMNGGLRTRMGEKVAKEELERGVLSYLKYKRRRLKKGGGVWKWWEYVTQCGNAVVLLLHDLYISVCVNDRKHAASFRVGTQHSCRRSHL